MNINIQNNIPNVDVTLNKSADGSVSILLTEKKVLTLGDIKCGEITKLGGREFYVLGHGAETTAVLVKDSVKRMSFGGNGDWRKSDVRSYCNGDFYKELAAAIGAENIVQHTVKLVADDGTGKGISCKDNVSILTTELYRRYREYLPAMDEPWWTATRVTHDDDTGYARYVCCVDSYGILGWDDCDYSYDVRPFCILNSSILVS